MVNMSRDPQVVKAALLDAPANRRLAGAAIGEYKIELCRKSPLSPISFAFQKFESACTR